MNLVENDEPVLGEFEEVVWVVETSTVIRVFKIEVDGVSPLADRERERRLADLPRSNQDNRGLEIKGRFDLILNESF